MTYYIASDDQDNRFVVKAPSESSARKKLKKYFKETEGFIDESYADDMSIDKATVI